MYGSKHRTTDSQYETRKDNSGYSSTKREWNGQTHETNEDSTSHRKYIRTQSSSNNRIVSSSSSQQQRQNGDKDKKTSKDTKKPLRIFGDWSEFKSSTGKTYFYNSKTEVSQWEKPKGWPTDDSSSRATKKDSINVNISPTNRSRQKIDEINHSNGDQHSQKSNHIQSIESSTNRLPSPIDESSRMSFSSTNSSKEPSTINNTNSDRNGHTQLELNEKDSIIINGTDTRRSSNPSVQLTEQTIENEPTIPSITKAERDQEMQKYYRAELIQHLTDWPANHYEKQCLKLFDDYYGYSAKISTNFVELKALKSNFRVLEIKRSILTQRLLRCQKHIKEREDDKLL